MKKNVNLIRKIALFRMQRLFELAEKKERVHDGDALARRYTGMLREIGRHYKVKVPKQYADRLCKHCGRVLIPGINCKVRVAGSSGYVVYKCVCGTEKHVFYKKRATSPQVSQAAR